jgi:hypothetical protein
MAPAEKLAWLLALLATALPAVEAGADPPIPVNPELTEPARLRYHFESGERLTFRDDASFEASIYSAVEDRNLEAQLGVTADHEWTVQTVDDDGTGVIYQELEVLEAALEVDEEERSAQTHIEGLEGFAGQLRVDRLGRLLASESGRTSDRDPDGARVPILEDLRPWLLVALPEREVDIGDTWTQEYPIELDRGGFGYSATLLGNFTFLGYADVGAVRCAVIKADYQLRLSVMPGGQVFAVAGPGLGRGVGVAYHYFDLTRGRPHRGFVDFGLVMRATSLSTPIDLLSTMSLEYGPPGQ